MGSNPLLSGSLNFSGSSVLFGSFVKFINSWFSGLRDHCSGTDCKLIIEWWENCIVYSLFCVFIMFIIINSIISSISISFVVLLNCLHLNPWVFPFAHFSSPSHGGEGGWERLSGAQLLAADLNQDIAQGLPACKKLSLLSTALGQNCCPSMLQGHAAFFHFSIWKPAKISRAHSKNSAARSRRSDEPTTKATALSRWMYCGQSPFLKLEKILATRMKGWRN